MNIIACVDDHMGLLFNNRRQSRDKKVLEKIAELTKDTNLLIHSFSAKLFGEGPKVDDHFLESAKKEDFCFVENVSVAPHLDQIEKLYLFKWNRDYPFDFIFDLEPEQHFNLISTQEFEGNSHEKITLEVWSK